MYPLTSTHNVRYSGKKNYLYHCTHEGSHGRCTASIDDLGKWLETRNTDPDIITIFADALLYIAVEGNDLPQCPNVGLHYDILQIGWTSKF